MSSSGLEVGVNWGRPPVKKINWILQGGKRKCGSYHVFGGIGCSRRNGFVIVRGGRGGGDRGGSSKGCRYRN